MFVCNEHLLVQNFMELVRYISIMEFRHSKVLKDQLNVSLCKATHFASLKKGFVNKHYHTVAKDCIPPDVLLVTEKGDVSITSLPELTGACV